MDEIPGKVVTVTFETVAGLAHWRSAVFRIGVVVESVDIDIESKAVVTDGIVRKRGWLCLLLDDAELELKK